MTPKKDLIQELNRGALSKRVLYKDDGVIVIDNTVWQGKIVNPNPKDEPTMAIDSLNKKLYKDSRVHLSFLSIADGVTLCIKK